MIRLEPVVLSGPEGTLPLWMIRLYRSAFPPEERRSVDSLTRLAATDPRFSIFRIVSSGGADSGFVTLWDFGAFRYVEHFAICHELRGAGTGAEVLRLLKEATPASPLVLEVEPAGSTPEADRRIRFYRRAGFALHDRFPYLQPPYSAGLSPVELTLMSSGPLPLPLGQVSETLHREVYGTPE
ncbi:MAG: hypothetical protein NC336_03290 [Clostridium sp.]|nr:hypothetical protein [Clostridium sp.]